MKILSASARKVHGFLDIYVEFNDDLTFIIGPNGSGKTTILYMMQLALSFSIERLVRIEFSELKIKLIDDREIVQVIKFERINDDMKILLFDPLEASFLIRNVQRDPYRLSMIKKDLSANPRYPGFNKFIQTIQEPCFLNVERIEGSIDFDSNRYYDPRLRREIERNQKHKLKTISELITSSFENIADQRENIQNKLYTDMFMSLFTQDPQENINQLFEDPDISKLTNIKKEVHQLIYNTFSAEDQIKYDEIVTEFFNKLLIHSESHHNMVEQDRLLQRLALKFQVDRILDLNDTYKEFNYNLKKINLPIKQFETVLNDFYMDCDISVSIDALGRAVVNRPDGSVTGINKLSSGETQLLIIFSHLIFGTQKDNKIFIVDEPELSLHLRWQETLVEKIMSFKPTLQIILATHSPDIIGKYHDKAWNLKYHGKA